LKINFPNLVVAIKILTGAFAFLIFILIGALCGTSMTVLFFGGIVTYAFFFVLGSVIARLLAEVNKEIEIEPLAGEKPAHERDLKHQFDVQQGAELPIFD